MKLIPCSYRLIGLEPLVLSSCDRDIRVMSYNLKYSFDSFILPILMLLTYFVLALTAKCLSNANVSKKFTKLSTNTLPFRTPSTRTFINTYLHIYISNTTLVGGTLFAF